MIKNNLKKIILNFLIVFSIFLIDRLSKIYIINLAKFENVLDVYIAPYLNFYLVWNRGISFGLFPFNDSLSYRIVSFIISIAIIIIIIMALKEDSNFKKYKFAIGCTIKRDNFNDLDIPQIIVNDAMIIN